jgi:hypothetical protein
MPWTLFIVDASVGSFLIARFSGLRRKAPYPCNSKKTRPNQTFKTLRKLLNIGGTTIALTVDQYK